jgi:hypothetical protein
MPKPNLSNIHAFLAKVTPRGLWEQYRRTNYGPEPLPPQQEKECSNAFYAGINAANKVFAAVCDDASLSVEEADEAFTLFMEQNRIIALAQNPTGEN